MPSVRNTAGMFSAYSESVSDAYGAAPLLCHVSSTNNSRSIFEPHFLHFITILSIHGLCSSKFGPSGSSEELSTMSFLEKNHWCSPQFLQFHSGNGHPHILSRDMPHGCLSLIISRNLFFGCSKKYS